MGGIKAFQIFYKTIGKVVGKQAHKADDAVSIMVKPPKYPARNTPEYWARHRNSRLTSRISPDANPHIETKSEALGLFDKFKTKIKKRCAIRKAKE